MLSAEDNELLTRTGPGTAMGEFFRRFWMPVLSASAIRWGGWTTRPSYPSPWLDRAEVQP